MSRVFLVKSETHTEGSWTVYNFDFRTEDVAHVSGMIEWAAKLPNQCQYPSFLDIKAYSDAPPSAMQFHITTHIYGDDLAAEFKLKFL